MYLSVFRGDLVGNDRIPDRIFFLILGLVLGLLRGTMFAICIVFVSLLVFPGRILSGNHVNTT